jgi:branched-chain amino acid transport system substrate-binding protein
MLRRLIAVALAAVLGWALHLAAAPVAHAADVVKIACVAELSGGGTVSGTNFRDGLLLAAKDINASGGILGRKVEVTVYDSQSNPGISRAQVTKALDEKPYVLFGTVYSSSTKVNMILAQEAGVPQITGSEAAEITEAGNPYIFRTSFGQQATMPKLVGYIKNGIKAKSVAVIWVNDAFGKGGRDTAIAEFEKRGVKVVADLSTEVQQVDFSAEVAKSKASKADVVFPYLHEEEAARLLKELRKQGYSGVIAGDTSLVSSKTLELAGGAGDGVLGFVGLSADAPSPLVKKMVKDFEAAYKYKPDHNGLKGYIGLYVVKAMTERMGKFDSKELAKELHGAHITTKQEPGVLMDLSYDGKGDLDRESFLIKVIKGTQEITDTIPAGS